MNYISENIHMLKEHGVVFAMDDFSMGHTSLKYIGDNLFSYVKLDGNLVKDITENERSEEIVSSIISLGRKLNFEVVAEYVDSKDKRDTLRELGCDYFQGYFYSPAVTAEAIQQFYNELMIK